MITKMKTRSRVSSIGLDVDGHEFRAVQLIQAGGEERVVAWAVFPRREEGGSDVTLGHPGADELRWAGDILERRGFVGKTVSITPSTADCSSHVIELPPAQSGAPVEQLARMEIARDRRCSPDEFQLGLWELPAKGRSHESLAVACSQTVIDSTIERYEQAGFIAAGIDLMELAVCRGGYSTGLSNIQSNTESDRTPAINTTLHIGWTSSLAVISLGHTVVYVRRIEHGATTVWEQASGRYGLSNRGADRVLTDFDADDKSNELDRIQRSAWASLATQLANELDVAVAYVSHSYRMAPHGHIQLSGYGTQHQVIRDQLDKKLGIPFNNGVPVALADAIGSDHQVHMLASRLSIAYGLAARFDQ